MSSLEPAMLVLGIIGELGIIELIMWLVVIIRHPGFDDLRPDLNPHATSTQPEESGTSRTVMS